MPITPFLKGPAFDPELVRAMGEAYSKTCYALGLKERDPTTTLVAEKIIELAERGVRNPPVMHSMAMSELYRLYAEQCRTLVAQTRTPEHKHALEAMAREWESIASQLEGRLLEEIDRRTGVDALA